MVQVHSSILFVLYLFCIVWVQFCFTVRGLCNGCSHFKTQQACSKILHPKKYIDSIKSYEIAIFEYKCSVQMENLKLFVI